MVCLTQLEMLTCPTAVNITCEHCLKEHNFNNVSQEGLTRRLISVSPCLWAAAGGNDRQNETVPESHTIHE